MKTIKDISDNNLNEEFIITNDERELMNVLSIKSSAKEAALSKDLIRSRVMSKIDAEQEIEEVYNQPTIRHYFTKWRSIAAVITIAIIVGAGVFVFKAGYHEGAETIAVNQISTKVPNGSITSLTLPDGTQVTLNSGSKLDYPSTFNDKQRVVELSGEAIFKVTKNPNQPFIVRTPHLDVKVLGTVFNLKSYSTDKNVVLTLAEGKVEAKSKSTKEYHEVVITPNQQVKLNLENGEMAVDKVDAMRYFSWKDGELYFQNNTLEDISHVLARQFNAQISFKDNSIKKELYFCQFNKNDKLDRILELLSQQSNWSFTINGKEVVLTKNKSVR